MRLSWQKQFEWRMQNGECRMTGGIFFVFLISFILHFTFYIPTAYAQSSVLDLNSQIQNKKQAQQDLQQKINEYSAKIRITQRTAASLVNQISILDSNINKAELEIRRKELEAEQLALENQLVQKQMAQEEAHIALTRQDVEQVLREINKQDARKYLKVILAENSFSQAFDQLYRAEHLINELSKKLADLKSIRETLEYNQAHLTNKQKEAEDRKLNLAILQTSFEQEKRAKNALFGKTKSTEAEFQSLLTELRSAAASIDSEIVTLEKNIRQKLDIADKLAGDSGVLSWPVAPIGGLSAVFHDADYPFRYLFEHGGIDIRTPQGTPVRAAASGYVAKAFNGGMGIRPSYIMLLHGNQLTTVYMHMSSINVTPDIYVARGDIIGYSGGRPGTSGAGRWTTGPHLHFETRLSSIPVNPVGYLP